MVDSNHGDSAHGEFQSYVVLLMVNSNHGDSAHGEFQSYICCSAHG
jgi:hypothetical protein